MLWKHHGGGKHNGCHWTASPCIEHSTPGPMPDGLTDIPNVVRRRRPRNPLLFLDHPFEEVEQQGIGARFDHPAAIRSPAQMYR